LNYSQYVEIQQILFIDIILWAGHQWLTPVIRVSWEAEIRRMEVWYHPGQIVHKTPSPKKSKVKWELEVWFKWYTTCFASMKSWIQTPIPPKSKQKPPNITFCNKAKLIFVYSFTDFIKCVALILYEILPKDIFYFLFFPFGLSTNSSTTLN
jgi:hypothetical protein